MTPAEILAWLRSPPFSPKAEATADLIESLQAENERLGFRLRNVQMTLLEQAASGETESEGVVVVRMSRELIEQMAAECAIGGTP